MEYTVILGQLYKHAFPEKKTNLIRKKGTSMTRMKFRPVNCSNRPTNKFGLIVKTLYAAQYFLFCIIR